MKWEHERMERYSLYSLNSQHVQTESCNFFVVQDTQTDKYIPSDCVRRSLNEGAGMDRALSPSVCAIWEPVKPV